MISKNPFKHNYIVKLSLTHAHVERYQTSLHDSIGAALILLSAAILFAFGGE